MIGHSKKDDSLLFFHLIDFSKSYLQSATSAMSAWGCAQTEVVSI